MADFCGIAVDVHGTKFICAGQHRDGAGGHMVEVQRVVVTPAWETAGVDVTDMLDADVLKDINVAVLEAIEEGAAHG